MKQVTAQHASEPTDDRECREAIWSYGKSCHNCGADCYRRGWKSSRVIEDNAARVKRNNEALAN